MIEKIREVKQNQEERLRETFMNIYRKDSALIQKIQTNDYKDENERGHQIQSEMEIEVNDGGNSPTNIEILAKIGNEDDEYAGSMFNIDTILEKQQKAQGM